MTTAAFICATDAPYSAVADAQVVGGGAMTSGSPNLSTSGSPAFAAGDVGKTIRVAGAGASGTDLITTVKTFTSASAVVLNANAVTTVSAAQVVWGTDNHAALQSLVTAVAGSGQVGWVPSGDYLVASPITVPNGKPTNLSGYGATLVGAMSTSGAGGFANSVFYGALSTITTLTTLASSPGKGSRSLSATAAAGLAVGQTIVILHSATGSNVAQQFTIESLSGTSITTDDATEWTFLSGDDLQAVTCPQHVVIEGFTFSGTGDRAVELACAANCIIRDCSVTRQYGSFTSIVMSFDVGGRDNLNENNAYDGGGKSAAGPALESNVRSTIRRARVKAMGATTGNPGIFIPSGARCVVEDCKAQGCGFGITVSDADSTDADGPMHISIIGCDFNGNAQGGMYLQSCKDTKVVSTSSDFSTGVYGGLYLSSGVSAGANINLQLEGVSLNDNAVNGLLWSTPGHRVTAHGLTVDRSGGDGILVNNTGTLEIAGLFSEDANNAGAGQGVVTVAAAADVTVKGARVRKLASTKAWSGVATTAAATVSMDDWVSELAGGSGTDAVLNAMAASNVRLRDVRSVGALSYGLISDDGFAGTIRILDGCNLASCTHPTSFDADVMINRGTVMADGVNPVSIPFSDFAGLPFESLKLTPPFGSAYVSSQSPPQIKSIAGDFGTYEYEIT